MENFSFANGANASFIDDLYKRYKADPGSVDLTWQKFFEGVDFAVGQGLIDQPAAASSPAGEGHEGALVEAYINAYRRMGHLCAHLNPLMPKPAIAADMQADFHGLGKVDRQKKFFPVNLPKKDGMTFAEIEEFLRETYAGSIGAEFRDGESIEEIVWLQEQMEPVRNRPDFSKEEKLRILHELVRAEGFEQFLQTRYLGQKRFSIEGVDALMPFLHTLAEEAVKKGVEEMGLGMAHRGRLNVLTNFMGKTYELMLKEFEGLEFNPHAIDGDVKYHMGYANEVTIAGKTLRLYLSPNPSHLEAVDPVLEGFIAARQRMLGDKEGQRVVPVLIHGDASVAGQGIVAETLNLAHLNGYATGGTIHVILNNQIGFTTNPSEARSCRYASGIAKLVNAPVLHVNADDPEAVAWCAKLAVAYRMKFQSDIFVDIVGYRRHGHNETDEPGFTQPLMYKNISAHKTVLTLYGQKLVEGHILDKASLEKQTLEFRARLQEAYEIVKSPATKTDHKAFKKNIPVPYKKIFEWAPVSLDELEQTQIKTGVSVKKLKDLGDKITHWPSSFKPHPKVVRLFEGRAKMLEEGSIDWPFAELLAFASLAEEGHTVRLSGQDCQRGTFSSRHGVISDFETGERLEVLNQLSKSQGRVQILNSPLSEQGVMGFDFGYSVADSDALVLWEGQFGDFVNGAQIIIDQFLVASEQKWKQRSGLCLLLPHGYEGMGPEHSSARPERFLQLSGNHNIQVVYATTAAQYFHVLRRQIVRDFRKPLIMMSPKSLLRHPKVQSPLDEFEKSTFREVLDDPRELKSASVKRVVFCTGKIFYELMEAAEKEKKDDVAIVRIEQLYPFVKAEVQKALTKYPAAKEVVWCQEEPKNMGAWTFIEPRLRELLASQKFSYAGRRDSGTTAEGSSKAHAAEQARIIEAALKG